MNAASLVEQVRAKYAAVGVSALSGPQVRARSVAEAFGYTPSELASVPAEAQLGLSCGNQTATAHLRAGEAVADLGSGAGIDVLLASLKVGPTGKAIGIDMTPESIERANASSVKFDQGTALATVKIRLGRLGSLLLEDASVDCLNSNCVLNLVPDKRAAFREVHRVLKPGGRVASSNIALERELHGELAQGVAAYVSCVVGAISVAKYERLLHEVGFADVQIVDTRKDINVYAKIEKQSGCCGGSTGSAVLMQHNPALIRELAELISRHDVNDYAASVQVYTLKT